ncbi:MAG: thioredoxin-disulfide reductase [Candidatus Omnitrophica bacterium]|nr:thioredoxin-disulfide reductase [Candidatus Omnitrophota bacterium]
MKNKLYDLVIVGAGPAGLTACLYALRFRGDVLLVDKLAPGGYLGVIGKLENYPGFAEPITGQELLDRIMGQLKQYDFNFQAFETEDVRKTADNYWQLKGRDESLFAKTVIIATGSSHKQLGARGEEEFKGKGVSYCATCDGPLYNKQDVVVIGGGNTALEEALLLTRFAATVTIIHRRDQFRADQILRERVAGNKKIKILMDSVCTEIVGELQVAAVKVKDKSGTVKDILCRGVFISVGMSPQTRFLKDIVDTDSEGYIVADEHMRTKAAGVFAAGDCRNGALRQVITACADGAVAANSAWAYLAGK